jgi:predicted nucleic acid-binding protein
MSVLDPQALDQGRRVAARLGELLAHALAQCRSEGIDLPNRGLAGLLHRGYQSSGPRTSLCQESLDHSRAPVDLLIAAVAESYGAVLLHYDRHFDAIVRATGQPAH